MHASISFELFEQMDQAEESMPAVSNLNHINQLIFIFSTLLKLSIYLIFKKIMGRWVNDGYVERW